MTRPATVELSTNSELLTNDRNNNSPASLLRECLHSAAYAGLQAPVSGVTQIVDRTFGTKWQEGTSMIAAPEQSESYSARWHAQQVGAAAGMIIPFLALHKGVGKAGNLMLGKAESLGVSNALAGRVIGEAATTGALYEGIFRPVQASEGDFLAARTRNAAVGGLTFATLAGATVGIKNLAAAERGTVGAVLRSDVGATVLAGLPAGFVSAEATSLLSGKGLATRAELTESMYTFAMVGTAMAGGKKVLGTTHAERTMNDTMRQESAQARAERAPTLAERMNDGLGNLQEGARNLANNLAGPQLAVEFGGVGGPLRMAVEGTRPSLGDNMMFMSRPKNTALKGGLGGGNPFEVLDRIKPQEAGGNAVTEVPGPTEAVRATPPELPSQERAAVTMADKPATPPETNVRPVTEQRVPAEKPANKPQEVTAKPNPAKPAEQAFNRAIDSFERANESLRDQRERVRLEQRVDEAQKKIQTMEEQPDPAFANETEAAAYAKKQLAEYEAARTELERAERALNDSRVGHFISPERPIRAVAEAVSDAVRAVQAEPSGPKRLALAKEAGVALEKLLGQLPDGYKGAKGKPDFPRFNSLARDAASRMDPVRRLNELNDHLQQRVGDLNAADAARRVERAAERAAAERAVLELPVVKDIMTRAQTGNNRLHPHPQVLVVFLENGKPVKFNGGNGHSQAGFTATECADPATIQERLAGRNIDGAILFTPHKHKIGNRWVVDMKTSRYMGTVPKGLGSPTLRDFLKDHGEQH